MAKQLKLITLPNFNPEAYRPWSHKVESILHIYNLWELTIGEETRPNLHARNPTAEQRNATKDWDDRNNQAYGSLLQTIDESNTAKFYEVNTAKGIWDRLKLEYGQPNSSKMLLALNTLSNIKPEDSKTLDEHLKKFERAHADLIFHAQSDFLPKHVVNTTLLGTLGQPFLTTRQALNPQLNQITLPALFELIRTADIDGGLWKQSRGIEIEALHTQVTPLESRLTALETRLSNSINSGNGRGNSHRGRGRYRGNSRGGFRGSHRGSYRGRNRFTNSHSFRTKTNQALLDVLPPYDPNVSCRYCKNKGHDIEHCVKKALKDRNPVRQSNNRNGDSSYEPSFNFNANVTCFTSLSMSSIPKTSPYIWVVDSAADACITPFQERLYNYKLFKYIQDVKGVGGKTIHALGTGSVTLCNGPAICLGLTTALTGQKAQCLIQRIKP